VGLSSSQASSKGHHLKIRNRPHARNGYLVSTARRFLRLRVEETASRYGG
jgi:hypothetical protein